MIDLRKVKQQIIIILLLCGGMFTLLTTSPTASSYFNLDANKIVIGTGVRMRSSPDLKADVLKKLTLGSIVHTSKRTMEKQQIGRIKSYWYYLDTEKGWVFGHLLREVKAKNQEAIHLKLVQERIAKKKLSFKDHLALYQYIKRILPEIKTVEIQAELKWQMLIALQQAADKISFDQYEKEPYVTFIKKHQQQKTLFYAEIQGRYLVPSDLYRALAQQYANLTIADKITWFAINAPEGGECEGEATCMFGRMVGNEGHYIKHYPKGRYVENALQQAIEVVSYIIKNVKNNPKEIDKETIDRIKEEMKILKTDLKKVNASSKNHKKLQTQLDILNRM